MAEATQESQGSHAVRKFMGMMTPGEMVQNKATTQQSSAEEIAGVAEEVQTVDPELEKQLIAQIRSIDVSPELSYEQRLSKLGVDAEEAAKIVDAILSQGFYEREFLINKKHGVTLRTRGVEDQERLQNSVENQVPRYALTINEMTARHNLAASLAEFNGVKFAPNEFKKAYAAVGKFALPVFNALISRLAKFDQIMFTVLSEGAVENF
jgi:hypothetical protein